MLTRIAIAGAALVVVAGVSVGVAAASSPAPNSDGATTSASGARVLRLVGVQAWKTSVPVPRQNPNQNRLPGDQQLMVQNVNSRITGHLVAHALIHCQMFRKDSLCEITFVFPSGQITGAGKIPMDTNSHPFIVPVTGGSGPYQNARGQVVVSNSNTQNSTNETIYLLP